MTDRPRLAVAAALVLLGCAPEPRSDGNDPGSSVRIAFVGQALIEHDPESADS